MTENRSALVRARDWLLPERIHSIESPHQRTLLISLALVTAAVFATGERYYFFLTTVVMIYAIVAVALDFFSGYLGEISVAHAGIMGIGAYASAILTVDYGFTFWVGFVVAGLLSLVVALLLGLAAFRTTSHYFVLATLAVAILIERVLVVWEPVTGGSIGILSIPKPTAIELPMRFVIDFGSQQGYLGLVATVLIVTVLSLNYLVNRPIGRKMVAVRENEALAATQGIDTKRVKLFAFGVSALVTGFAGSLYAHYIGFISPASFPFFEGFVILVITIIGGLGTLTGALVGATVIKLFQLTTGDIPNLRRIVYGLMLLTVVLFFPSGIWGTIKMRYREWRQ